MESIKERFRASGGGFGETMAQAAARLPGPSLGAAIAAAASRHGLDPAVLTALTQAESGFRPDAVSEDGAVGLTQLMPSTATRLGVTNPLEPIANLEGGAKYLREQLDRFSGDLSLALAAYNAGPTAVTRHGGIPPYAETQRFVSRVLDLARRYSHRGE